MRRAKKAFLPTVLLQPRSKSEMSLIHVYKLGEEKFHRFTKGADCPCEPLIENCGLDLLGKAARVFVHAPLGKEVLNMTPADPRIEKIRVRELGGSR